MSKIQSKLYVGSKSKKFEKEPEVKSSKFLIINILHYLCLGLDTSMINSEEISGISKIKSKLSLKVLIPNSKKNESELCSYSDTKVRFY